MKRLLCAVLVALSGCASLPPDAQRAECYLFPKFKASPDAQYVLSRTERQRAVLEWKRMRAEILYEMVVDDAGKVVRIRTIRAWEGDDRDQYFTHNFLLRLKESQFEEDAVPHRYRTFYYPLDLKHETEFFNWPGD